MCDVPLILLSLAAYRLTRLVVSDTVWAGRRTKMLRWFAARNWGKAVELFNCPFCMSVWIAGGLVLVTDLTVGVQNPGLMWPAVAGGALVAWRYIEE